MKTVLNIIAFFVVAANKEVNCGIKGENFHAHLRDHTSKDDKDCLFNCC